MTGVNQLDQLDQYVRGFRDRVHVMRKPGQRLLEAPGLIGLLGRPDTVEGRVLVTDDRPADLFARHVPRLNALVVNVFAAAATCHRLLLETGRYRLDPSTAMVCSDLAAVPEPALPAALSLHPVDPHRDPGSGSGVRLEEAAAAALEADSSASPSEELPGFLRYLRSIPGAQFFAATDASGRVRATSASASFGTSAGVFFVNTDLAWRGRGVGTSMTAAALRAASLAGARDAILDASALGLPIYRRLGFTVVSPTTLFVRTT